MKVRYLAGIAIIVASAALAGCTAPPSEEARELRVGVAAPALALSWNPVYTPAGTFDAAAVYEPLFRFNVNDGSYSPVLATEFVQSDDWRSITITLREDVEFSDGTPLTAETVKAYLDGVSAMDDWWFLATWAPYAPTVTVIDDYTFEISSDQSLGNVRNGMLNNFLCTLFIASPSALEDLEGATTAPIGTGPYLVDSVDPLVSVELVRNPDYWNPDAAPFDTVEVFKFDDDIAMLNALQAGQVDTIAVSSSNIAIQAKSAGFAIFEGSPMYYGVVVFDREGKTVPALADRRVRQAIAMAFDRDAINENINHGFGAPATQIFGAGTAEYDDQGDLYEYDPDRARELLAEAGYADGLELAMPSTAAYGYNQFDAIILSALGDIGIQVKFDVFPDVSSYFTALFDGEYGLAMVDGGISALWIIFAPAPTGILNVFGVADPVVDSYWKVIEGPATAAEVEAAFDGLGAYINEEAFFPGITAQSLMWAARSGITVDLSRGNPTITDIGLEE
jgi:peptide/nickel transport system substrate-binding protein